VRLHDCARARALAQSKQRGEPDFRVAGGRMAFCHNEHPAQGANNPIAVDDLRKVVEDTIRTETADLGVRLSNDLRQELQKFSQLWRKDLVCFPPVARERSLPRLARRGQSENLADNRQQTGSGGRSFHRPSLLQRANVQDDDDMGIIPIKRFFHSDGVLGTQVRKGAALFRRMSGQLPGTMNSFRETEQDRRRPSSQVIGRQRRSLSQVVPGLVAASKVLSSDNMSSCSTGPAARPRSASTSGSETMAPKAWDAASNGGPNGSCSSMVTVVTALTASANMAKTAAAASATTTSPDLAACDMDEADCSDASTLVAAELPQQRPNSQDSSIVSVAPRLDKEGPDIVAPNLVERPIHPRKASIGSMQSRSSRLEAITGEVKGRIGKCRYALVIIVESVFFDCLICGCILLNAVSIGIQTDFNVRHIGKAPPEWFRIVETGFCVIFTLELGFRLSIHHWSFFYNSEWKWNWFDTVIVCLQLVEELTSIFVGESQYNITEMSGNMNFVRVLRILRLVRIIRLVRLLRFISELRTMVCSIAISFRSLCWTLVLLLLLMFTVSMYLMQLIADEGMANPDLFSREPALEEFFGSLWRCVLTLFQAMTGGVDWNVLIVPLVDRISPLLAFVFSFYIAFAVLAMMNVITGVFVESALLTAKEDKEAHLLNHVRVLFDKTDSDRSGTISWEEFSIKLSDPNMIKYFKVLDIDMSEARGLFTLLDTDDSGEINAEEFVMGCLRLRGPAKAIDLATMMYFNKRFVAKWRESQSLLSNNLNELFTYLEESIGVIKRMESGDRSLPNKESRGDLTHRGDHREAMDGHLFATWAELKAEGHRKAMLHQGGVSLGQMSPSATHTRRERYSCATTSSGHSEAFPQCQANEDHSSEIGDLGLDMTPEAVDDLGASSVCSSWQ